MYIAFTTIFNSVYNYGILTVGSHNENNNCLKIHLHATEIILAHTHMYTRTYMYLYILVLAIIHTIILISLDMKWQGNLLYMYIGTHL